MKSPKPRNRRVHPRRFSLLGRSQFFNRILGELDIINAYERIRAYYLKCAEAFARDKNNIFEKHSAYTIVFKAL